MVFAYYSSLTRAQQHIYQRSDAVSVISLPQTAPLHLLVEVCHHLGHELLGLEESFHTEGFYRRESSLFHQLVGNRPDRVSPTTDKARKSP
ncbi:MAG: hypothetical protein ACE5I9_13060 [Candidatus Methylomirabilales bacterium]